MKELSLYEKCLLRIELMKLAQYKNQIEQANAPFGDKCKAIKETKLTEKYIRKAMKGEL